MSVQKNGFSVEIPECLEETNEGYAVMRHGDKFTIRMYNHHKKNGYGCPCDATVYVEGKNVGTFRLEYGDSFPLERSVRDNGCFTAYKRDTPEARAVGVKPDSDDAGLIRVVFRPGTKKPRYNITWNIVDQCMRKSWDGGETLSMSYDSPVPENYASNYSTAKCATSSYNKERGGNSRGLVSGGVGLSGHSSQSFREVEDLDYNEPSTVITLRLAFCDDEPRPLNDVVYQPTSYCTKVPRPLR